MLRCFFVFFVVVFFKCSLKTHLQTCLLDLHLLLLSRKVTSYFCQNGKCTILRKTSLICLSFAFTMLSQKIAHHFIDGDGKCSVSRSIVRFIGFRLLQVQIFTSIQSGKQQPITALLALYGSIDMLQ